MKKLNILLAVLLMTISFKSFAEDRKHSNEHESKKAKKFHRNLPHEEHEGDHSSDEYKKQKKHVSQHHAEGGEEHDDHDHGHKEKKPKKDEHDHSSHDGKNHKKKENKKHDDHGEDEHGHAEEKHEEHGKNGEHKEGGHEDEHGEHSAHGESSKFGPGRAITSVEDEGKRFKLSQESEKTIGVDIEKVTPLELKNHFKVPLSSIVEFLDETGVFKYQNEWISLIEIKVIKKEGNYAVIKTSKLKPEDQVIVKGVPLVRVAHLEASGQGGQGHAH